MGQEWEWGDDSRETSLGWERDTLTWSCWQWCSGTEPTSEGDERVKVRCYYQGSPPGICSNHMWLAANVPLQNERSMIPSLKPDSLAVVGKGIFGLRVSYRTSSVSSDLNSQGLSRIYRMLILEGWLLCAWPIYSSCCGFRIAYFKTRHFP